MNHRLRWPIALTTLCGLAAMFWAMGSVGLGSLAHVVLSMGAPGFLLFCIGSLGLNVILGGAWWASMPAEPLRRWPLFAWARTAREGANDLLPFSQIGGLVVGVRTLTGAGLAPARVYAAMVVDISTEMASQAVFTLFGLLILGSLLIDHSRHTIPPLAWIGAAGTLGITIAFILLQRPLIRLAGSLVRKMAPDSDIPLDRIHSALSATYRRPGWVAASFAFNLAGWIIASALGALALSLIGSPLPVWRVIALESLIFALKAAAFFVPGGLGVQEAGYVLLAPLIGLDPESAIALSFLKRARDVVIGLPALIVWQASEIGMKKRLKV